MSFKALLFLRLLFTIFIQQRCHNLAPEGNFWTEKKIFVWVDLLTLLRVSGGKCALDDFFEGMTPLWSAEQTDGRKSIPSLSAKNGDNWHTAWDFLSAFKRPKQLCSLPKWSSSLKLWIREDLLWPITPWLKRRALVTVRGRFPNIQTEANPRCQPPCVSKTWWRFVVFLDFQPLEQDSLQQGQMHSELAMLKNILKVIWKPNL